MSLIDYLRQKREDLAEWIDEDSQDGDSKVQDAVEEGLDGIREDVADLMTNLRGLALENADIHAIDEVAGHKFENYFDWYTIAYAITATSLPALSLPCGFTGNGLPVAGVPSSFIRNSWPILRSMSWAASR